MVPFPAQGHLNQLLQLSCLISSYEIPVYYVGSAVHNRQAKAHANGLNPLDVAQIHFHDIPTTDPKSPDKFPMQLPPEMYATLNQRQPFAAFLREMSEKFKRVVVVHDSLMAVVVQDVVMIHNAESYAFNSISAFSHASLIWEGLCKPFPIEHPKELPSFEVPDEVQYFVALQSEPLDYRAGDIYNTCRLIETPYMDLLEKEEIFGKRTNEQIQELALGLEKSKVKFLWVLRDADKGEVVDGEIKRAELPEGFEERVEGVGMVVRDWAPQPQILAHLSIGGFMSHCGWNSCIESITMGVPIAAWPMTYDQPRNTSLMIDILKMGLVVREWKQRMEIVRASTVENVVRRLMASEEGDEIRKRVEELSAMVRQATEKGGASQLELDSFIAHITR
ncbi:hypothetical protein DH2020_013946 [Rehmannia glutinosa]|uniref:Glycosyltransferase N-terminal domain-containing protein n=1 Tax=Rehmannia glutinosa TaxID=99300 RepID=A0ABR0WVF6_REHGL